MSFANPNILWLLALIPPAMLVFFWWAWRTRQKLAAQFIQARLLPGLISGVSPARQKLRAVFLIVAVVCLIFTLARPQWGFDWEEVRQRGLDIVVAIDTSKSMLADDIAPNRLARAKLAALNLMQEAKSDRLGLVAFAGSAFLQCPLTVDDTAFRQSVESLDVNTIPEGGTALAEAINTALAAFKEGDNYKVLVLFSDGEDQDSGAVGAAKKAVAAGLRIFTIGVGSAEGELLRIQGANGQTSYVRDEQGNVVKSHLNETLLRQIAEATPDGIYLPLRGANTIDSLYQQKLAPLPKTESKEQWVKHPHERYHWPLALAMVLLIAEIFVPERRAPARRERTGKVKRAEPVPGIPTSAVFVLLILPTLVLASSSSALRDYKAGKFVAAQKEFERLSSTNKTETPRLIFNAGDAAYRATNYEAALKLFSDALATPDVTLQQKAYFNLGNTQFQLGKAAKNLDGVEQLWKQAIKSFENAVALDKNDADAANNLAFVKNNVAMIEQLREAARRAKAEADKDVRQRNYHRALEILEQQVQNNIAAKQFEDYVKKLKDIDEIATPNQR